MHNKDNYITEETGETFENLYKIYTNSYILKKCNNMMRMYGIFIKIKKEYTIYTTPVKL